MQLTFETVFFDRENILPDIDQLVRNNMLKVVSSDPGLGKSAIDEDMGSNKTKMNEEEAAGGSTKQEEITDEEVDLVEITARNIQASVSHLLNRETHDLDIDRLRMIVEETERRGRISTIFTFIKDVLLSAGSFLIDLGKYLLQFPILFKTRVIEVPEPTYL